MAPEKITSSRTRSLSVQHPRSHEHLKSLRYEQMRPARPPIPVTIAPPRAPPSDTHPALRRPATSPANNDAMKRDSGLAPMASPTFRENSVNSINECGEEILDVRGKDGIIRSVHCTPMRIDTTNESADKRIASVGNDQPQTPTSANSKTTRDEEFSPITTPIPSDSLLSTDFLDSMSFTKRGSMLLGGKKLPLAPPEPQIINTSPQPRLTGGRRLPSFSMLAESSGTTLSHEVERESQKVRSMYETGNLDWHDGKWSAGGERTLVEEEATVEEQRPNTSATNLIVRRDQQIRPASLLSNTRDSMFKREYELAGGIEDWEDINGKDVDRYGFISMRRKTSVKTGGPELRPPYRTSTVLQLASDAPRRRRTALSRALSKSKSMRSQGLRRTPSRRLTGLSIRTQSSSASTYRSASRSGMRTAVNRLPGNRDRRWMDEAGDMLTLPPGLADIAEDVEGGRTADLLKKKEWDRTEKWRRMAKLVRSGREGEGMQFEFDVKSSKVIDRTWKGIPDRWRATAWFSFLSQSAKKKEGSKNDDEIVDDFYRLLTCSSSDDVQIDIDVPRTINSHIMFRRRYRGGQRLLFRVLHCLSLYFPETGYVQGMASLAATLLCYFDEERCFVMLVRMWELRGLDKLYSPGFGGLMAALDEFSINWMGGGEVKEKLTDLGIDPTAYGTRWYLTLFNYSIPFAAQLRVWDVFMLLGDSDPNQPLTEERPFGGGLDILHATSAALIDGTRDILLDSDFENAMKVLTSWIPVKDEELLMKVARAEWKLHHGKKRNQLNQTKPN